MLFFLKFIEIEKLIPDPQETVPWASRYCHSIFGYTKTTDTIIVASQNAFWKENGFSIYFSKSIDLPARSRRSVSQTLQLKSSYAANRRRPDFEKATDVIPHMILSCEYMPTSWSARISNRRHVASSDPVANADPFGKNYEQKNHFLFVVFFWIWFSTYGYSIDIRLMAGKCLFTHAFSNIPKLI